jgi:hypothetical protein
MMTNQEKINQLIQLYKVSSPDFEEEYKAIVGQLTWVEFKQLAFIMAGELEMAVKQAERSFAEAEKLERTQLSPQIA